MWEQPGFRVRETYVSRACAILCYMFFRPNTGQSPFEEERKDLLNKYNKITPEDAGMYIFTPVSLSSKRFSLISLNASRDNTQLLCFQTRVYIYIFKTMYRAENAVLGN